MKLFYPLVTAPSLQKRVRPLSVLTLYNQADALHRAVLAIKDLEELRNRSVFSLRTINLDALQIHDNAEIAAAEAATADVIIVAIELDNEFPGFWKRWFLRALQGRIGTGGILSLTGSAGSGCAPYVRHYFRKLACCGGLEFHCDLSEGAVAV